MSKQLLLFLLRELTKVRITCKQCKTVMEVEIGRLNDAKSRPMNCVGCGLELRQVASNRGIVGADDAFNTLANAVEQLGKVTNAEIEFPLYKDDPPQP